MADYVEGYRTYLNEERHASANTLSSYLRDIRQFAQYLSMTEAGDLSQVQQGQIQAYVNWMTARGKSASTVTRSLAALKSFYHYLTEKGVVGKNTCAECVSCEGGTSSSADFDQSGSRVVFGAAPVH